MINPPLPPTQNSPPKTQTNIQTNKQIRLELLHKTQVICRSNHKTAKIFVKGFGFSKNEGLQL